jgi:hypothetical protein
MYHLVNLEIVLKQRQSREQQPDLFRHQLLGRNYQQHLSELRGMSRDDRGKHRLLDVVALRLTQKLLEKSKAGVVVWIRNRKQCAENGHT